MYGGGDLHQKRSSASLLLFDPHDENIKVYKKQDRFSIASNQIQLSGQSRSISTHCEPSKLNIYHLESDLSSSLFLDLPDTRRSEVFRNIEHLEQEDDVTVEWTDYELSDLWGHHGLEMNPYDDSERPFVKLKSYCDLELTPKEETGVLTRRVLATCSGYLDRNPDTYKYVICKYDLSKKSLRDISILRYYHHVQYLDLSENELTDLEPLGQMPFLIYLNVSHNDLTELLRFKPPFYLTYVDYSYNKIETIPDLGEFWSLVYLNLSHNTIRNIEGLQDLKYLRYLNLSVNQISKLENLDHMRLQTLKIHKNMIYQFEEDPSLGLKTLQHLKHFTISDNHLNTAKLFAGCTQIQNIDCSNNHIDSLMDLYYLRGMNLLSCASFSGNPIAEVDHYYEVCLDAMRHLIILDGELVEPEAKVKVACKFSANPQISASGTAARLMLLQQFKCPYIGLSVIPYTNAPPPIIILVGPPACKKGYYVKALQKAMPKFAIKGVSHTTRPKKSYEVEDEDYHYVPTDSFKKMLRDGDFLVAVESFEHCYGLARSELNKVITKGVLVLHTDLSAALVLRNIRMRPTLILAMPRSMEKHLQWLKESEYFPPTERITLNKFEETLAKAKREAPVKDSVVFLHSDSGMAASTSESSASAVRCEGEAGSETEQEHCTTMLFNKESSSGRMSGHQKSEHVRPSGILKKRISGLKRKPSVTFDVSKPVVGVHPSPDMQMDSAHNVAMDYGGIRSISEAGFAGGSENILSSLSRAAVGPEDEYEDEESLDNDDLSDSEFATIVDYFFQDVLEQRDVYLKVHVENPGLFTSVIFTDEIEESMAALKDLIKYAVNEEDTVPMYRMDEKLLKTVTALKLGVTYKELKKKSDCGDSPISGI